MFHSTSSGRYRKRRRKSASVQHDSFGSNVVTGFWELSCKGKKKKNSARIICWGLKWILHQCKFKVSLTSQPWGSRAHWLCSRLKRDSQNQTAAGNKVKDTPLYFRSCNYIRVTTYWHVLFLRELLCNRCRSRWPKATGHYAGEWFLFSVQEVKSVHASQALWSGQGDCFVIVPSENKYRKPHLRLLCGL